jgi:CDP-diacylglycerol--glycerol-3-phosphate 3-phosphatidyltransferase
VTTRARAPSNSANALTAIRVVLVPPFVFLMAAADARHAALAALVFALAIASDLLDGPLARRQGTATAAGGLFDHAADCAFVTAGLAAAATRGAVPWLLPLLVAAAFAQYVIDSYWVHRGRALRGSRLGRWNGILYFVPLGGDILVRAGLPPLAPVVTAIAWALVATTVLSMIARLRASPRRPE